MHVLILQPPIVQLNTAYPSGAYLASFFRSLGCTVLWRDLNIELFDAIFSRAGLERLFSLCEDTALQMADKAARSGDEEAAFNLRRYVSQQESWCAWIDTITALLRGGESAFESAHRFVFGAHSPRGSRMEQYLSNLNHDLTTDDARALASYALADLADFITAVFDKNFALVRYAERLTVSQSSFSQIAAGADSPVLWEFYLPVLERLMQSDAVAQFLQDTVSGKQTNDSFANERQFLVCVSVPFAGTFTPALCTGRFFKQKFGKRAFVSFGGGFINTELRDCNERALADYCDALSYDRGYAGYKQLIQWLRAAQKSNNAEHAETTPTNTKILAPKESFYKLRLFLTTDSSSPNNTTNIRKLYEGLLRQCQEKGVFGIHFVDEAMPPALMIQFARENLAHGSPLTWWGNIRFEKQFTRDVADFLAAGGLIGVSGGLEIATGSGLDTIHKGTDLTSIVAACCAFKEAGILVHAYMIYGYWKETPQDLINSMETLRQFYANGLLDSSFWHKFVLTRHSRIYKEWKEGKFPDLHPIDQTDAPLFAKNGLHFAGEEKSEKYGAGLEIALSEWMHGNHLNRAVQKWFAFSVPAPTVAKDFIAQEIARYEANRDAAFAKEIPAPARGNDSGADATSLSGLTRQSKVFWLGGKKIAVGKNKVGWFYLGDYYEASRDAPDSAFRGKGLCVLP